ncbi:baseplate assembly protein [Erwinia typographi]|uniref:Baseplate assembly protein n=2 Tax=Erwinia typographi TaxID=371042 RepID=A0A0A3Z832_9GAMM|nr:baseplate assembly protein [Erwinia typographi]
MYQGMNRDTGEAISDIDHIRQSVRDILMTPEGSRLARRSYGSLLSVLLDQPQNDIIRLQVMAATYSALSRWEPRIRLDSVEITSSFDGVMQVALSGQRDDGSPVSMTVQTGVTSGGN